MAHVTKYHKGALGHLTKHYERAKDENGNYIRFNNQNIDLTKTHSNYNLATDQPLSQIDFIQKRLSGVKVFKRADVRVMCDWIVTLPKGMEKNEKRFFEETFKFLSARYGQENVISAYVHKDETQPHLHFAFIPVVTDKKKNIKKVSAKEVLTRAELQKFHGDLDNYLTSVFGRSTGILNDATQEGNRSIDELKRGTAAKAVKEKREELQTLENRINKLKWPDKIEVLKEKKDSVLLSKEAYEAIMATLMKKQVFESRTVEAERKAAIATNEMKRAVNRDYEQELANLLSKLRELQSNNYEMASQNKELYSELDTFYKVLDKDPRLKDYFFMLVAETESDQMQM